MGNIILDEVEDNEPVGGIPAGAIHYFSRYYLCLVWFFGIIQLSFYLFTNAGSIDFDDITLILFLRILIPVFSIYYHLIHGFMEQKQKVYQAKFPKWIIGIVIISLCLKLAGTLYQTFSDLFYGILTFSTSLLILNVFCISVILLQEIKYYKWQR